jgi:hypothetical protein
MTETLTETRTLPRRALPDVLVGNAALACAEGIAQRLVAGQTIPYLGPGVIAEGEAAPVPITPEMLAFALNAKVPAPGRIRTNMWSVAQFIEQRRHRRTLVALMAEIFAPAVAPTALHRRLAALPDLPLIVDTWYDGAMRTALAGRDFVELQGVTRALEWGDVWTRAYGADGAVVDEAAVEAAGTLLYKPHGAITPAQNFLVADSDYVEVLTEIDIQTPIPEAVRRLRTTRGFLFIGCRFHDQMLRTFARQIMKRSTGPHVALLTDGNVTKNELKFFAECDITPVALPLSALLERLG